MIRLFRHYIPISLILLAIVETALIWVSLYGSFWFFYAKVPEITAASNAWVFSLTMLILMISFGLYQRVNRQGFVGVLVRILASFVVGFFLVTLMFWAMPGFLLGRLSFSTGVTLAFFSVVVSRYIFLGVVSQDMMKKRILILGAGNHAYSVSEQVKSRTDQRGVVVVGYVPMSGEKITVDEKNLIPYGSSQSLLEICQHYRIDEIVVAIEDRRKGFPVHEILDCKMSGVDVIDVLTFVERQTGRIQLDILHPSWMIFSDGFRQGTVRQYAKRIFDILASLLLLSITWPIMLLTALAIFVESKGRGPVFYKQIRVGEDWKLFHIIKFRSMYTDAEADGRPQWAQSNDSRITWVGVVIRKLRIDELPQIFNVLKGDMSFVGPRPERPEFVEELCDRIPYYAERHRVKPGLTGWAQICYPYGASEKDALEKLQYDLYYVKNYSLFLDFTVLFQTAEVILWGKGAR